MTISVVLDTSQLVGFMDDRDKWHVKAVAVHDALIAANATFVYFDPVINEAVSVLARRLGEQKRTQQFSPLLDNLEKSIQVEMITWISVNAERLYPEVLALVRQYNGKLNFHDALIALACKELDIMYICSFDQDFDQINWLNRIQSPDDVPMISNEE